MHKEKVKLLSTGFFLLILINPLCIAKSNTNSAVQTSNSKEVLKIAKIALEQKNWKKAYAELSTLAKKNNLEAQFQFGKLFRNGHGVEKNFQTAVFWYQKAALSGHRDAQVNLAISLELGRGIKKDTGQAHKWYLSAAQQNDSYAMHWLAKTYQQGTLVTKDIETSYLWYTMAREFEPDCGRIQYEQQQTLQQLSPSQLKSAQQRIQRWRNNGQKNQP